MWRRRRRARAGLFPMIDNLAALMALVMADVCESQRKRLAGTVHSEFHQGYQVVLFVLSRTP